MPSVSKKQHRFMAAVAHNPAFAKKAGVPQSVGQEFTQADTGRKFSRGGDMKEDAAYKAKEKKHVSAMKKAGVPRNIVREEEAEAGMKCGGKVKKMATGGYVRAADGVAQRGKTKAKQITMKKGGKC